MPLSSSPFSIDAKFAPEDAVLAELVSGSGLVERDRRVISEDAADLVRRIRGTTRPTLMERFLAEYGLSTREGVALMCLAEAMLRVPDSETIDALIEDKIAPSDWGRHLGGASSPLINASTWALMLTGKVLDDDAPGIAGAVRGAVRRLGEPVIRAAVAGAMREMGRQFVLGEDIASALGRAAAMEAKGYTHSYDMLGEAAATAADAERYAESYSRAIGEIARAGGSSAVEANPGISVKFSALHPRYEASQSDRVAKELAPRVLELARMAASANMGFTVDAEEQDRLCLSLDVIETVASDPSLAGWDGFGVVVQAYGKRAGPVIDWLRELAVRLDRKFMVRLVKGAYWDTEIKHAQVEGLPDFPVFTAKAATDVSYIANSAKLLDGGDHFLPQFATHNAHTVAAILNMARGRPFEFQRLHGMGERLHDIVLEEGGRCRIYAPVGAHRDLLAYLVRRLLENGANSSFVNQIVNPAVTPEEIAADPFDKLSDAAPPAGLVRPEAIFGAERPNSTGHDLADRETLGSFEAREDSEIPDAEPLTVSAPTGTPRAIMDPAAGRPVATVVEADAECVSRAVSEAAVWDAPASVRAGVLRRAAGLYGEAADRLIAALRLEAGKTLSDAVGELREAVDFLRYYAAAAEASDPAPRGVFAAISPWNFPLAIFTGQVAAALAAGNAVIAKPAEQTPLVAAMAVRLLRGAGVPAAALQLLPGGGPEVGAALVSDARVDGVAFTGSTATALAIRRAMAEHLDPGAPLIAETGGINAMIVDSTALPERAVRDIVVSAFQSAGQRCSALRCLYVQRDVAEPLIEMIKGAMDQLRIGDPLHCSTDVGPLIDASAREAVNAYVDGAAAAGRVLHRLEVPKGGCFAAPALVEVPGIGTLDREVFGPVLHVATFEADEIGDVVEAINGTGHGLTLGLHTRIDGRVQEVIDAARVGNLYVNRNQIGAVVGSQPFGGEGLSGTGPKAGGPFYLTRFAAPRPAGAAGTPEGKADESEVRRLLESAAGGRSTEATLPGPTGESNFLRSLPRRPALCLGPGADAARAQAAQIEKLGGVAVAVAGALPPDALARLDGMSCVLWWGGDGRDYARALSKRDGPIVPLVTAAPDGGHALVERHVCIDTTAAGGNAALLAG